MTPYTDPRPGRGSTVSGEESVEVAFTPALLPGPAKPGTGWLQPGGLVVHTGWLPTDDDGERDGIYRLEPYLRCLSEARSADLGLDGGDGLGDLFLPRRIFGPEILPMWRWKDGTDVAAGDRAAEIRLGQQYLTLALRTNVDGEGAIGFDVMVPCPFDPECGGYAWAPAFSITCLHRALTGELDNHEDIVCTVHGGFDDVDQEADDHAAQALQAARG